MDETSAILGFVTTETLTRGDAHAAPQLAAKGPVLTIVHGPDPRRIGDRLSLPVGAKTTLGRREPRFGAAGLGDPEVSGRHLEVEVTSSGLTARDLDSKNGTFVRVERVSSTTLSSGELIQVGSTILQFSIEAAVREADEETVVGGISVAAGALRDDIARAAKHALPVIVFGPTGAGKERVAQELHRLSSASGSLVALNCATLSGELAESELFGHVRGAFTGAERAREGIFQRAEGGTLFLDEINSLPLPLQPKLLRAIQEGRVRPVGATTEIQCNPRIVCATNEDLIELVGRGQFRKDLYARLHGSLIRVPGLSERREDLGWLAHAILAEAGHPRVRLSARLVWALLDNPWPLHVRSLQQCLLAHVGDAVDNFLELGPPIAAFLESQRALADDPEAEPAPEPESEPSPPTEAPAPAAAAKPARKAQAKRPPKPMLADALRAHHGRVERVAAQFGVRRQQIYRWIAAHGLELDEFRDQGPAS